MHRLRMGRHGTDRQCDRNAQQNEVWFGKEARVWRSFLRLRVVVPATLVIIFGLIYLVFRRASEGRSSCWVCRRHSMTAFGRKLTLIGWLLPTQSRR